jgi:OHCU decarboxylase
MSITQFNSLSKPDAVIHLLSFCGSRTWAHQLSAHAPFPGDEALFRVAEAIWSSLPETDWLEAFSAHPRIGESKGSTTDQFLASSTSEQSTTQSSLNLQIAAQLLALNRAYEERFGFRYIVFANNRTAPELLAILLSRLHNTRSEELQEAARQQHHITILRLTKWLNP